MNHIAIYFKNRARYAEAEQLFADFHEKRQQSEKALQLYPLSRNKRLVPSIQEP